MITSFKSIGTLNNNNILIILLLSIPVQLIGQTSVVQEEKRFFDFLIGQWKLEKRTDMGKSSTGDDQLTFKRALDGHAITSEWRFNRGTGDKPDYVNALYFSGYNTSTNVWCFYYISDRSAQYWEGKKENGTWNFYKDFSNEGLFQRQTWINKDANTLVRIIANSRDGGKTWNDDFIGTFTRIGKKD